MSRARRPPPVILLGFVTLIAGCGVEKEADGTGEVPDVRDAAVVRNEIAALSSAVLDMTGITGKLTEGGPEEVSCDVDDDEDVNREILHTWSLYGVPDATLEQGMDTLAAALPGRGWKVVKYGPDSSRARTPEILAVHLATRTQLEAAWMDGRDGEPLIYFSVYSPCFVKA